MAEGALSLVCSWARLECLLKLILLHLCSKTNLSTANGWTCFIFTWAREKISLTNTQIRAHTSTDNMSKILVINGSLVSLILSWSWHVKVLVTLAGYLDTHVELGVRFCLFKVSINLVGCRGRCKKVRPLYFFSNGFTDFNTMFDVCGIIWNVALWTNWL
jgi:hypothetical protein